MSKYMPQKTVEKEQVMQIIRRHKLEQSKADVMGEAERQFESVPTEVLKTAPPDTLVPFATLVSNGFTERHALTYLGRLFLKRLEADKQAALETAKAAKEVPSTNTSTTEPVKTEA